MLSWFALPLADGLFALSSRTVLRRLTHAGNLFTGNLVRRSKQYLSGH